MQLLLNDRCSVMPWNAIDNVVFDVGNVLLSFQPEKLLREILPDHAAEHPALLRCVFQSPYWQMMDRGVVDLEEAIVLMSCGHATLRPLIERVMRGWNDRLELIDEGVTALHACKAHDKRCYVLSNYSAAPFDHSCRKHPHVFSLFDGIMVSAKERLIKPDQRIFLRLIERFRLDPERTLFIDDSAANVESAMDCGLQALHYHQPGLLDAFIR